MADVTRRSKGSGTDPALTPDKLMAIITYAQPPGITLSNFPPNDPIYNELLPTYLTFGQQYPLHLCVILNKPAFFEQLLALGANPTVTNAEGKTPLRLAQSLASEVGSPINADDFQEILNTTATLVAQQKNAANEIDEAKLSNLLKGGAVLPEDETVRALLVIESTDLVHFIIERSDPDLTQMVGTGEKKGPLGRKLLCGSSTVVTDSFKRKTAHFLNQCRQYIERRNELNLPEADKHAALNSIDQILKKGLDLNQPIAGLQLAHIAATYNDTEVLRLLLKHKITESKAESDVPSMRIEESDTPLHIAARLGHTETLAMILRHLKPRGDHTPLHWHNCPRKVDLTACNAQGKTALDVAQNPIIRAMLDSYVTCQSIQDLVKNHGTEEIDRTTLEILFQKLNSLLDLLNAPIKATDLAGNAYYTNGLNYQVDLRDEQGWSPVHWAVSKQSIPMIQALQDLCDKYSFAAVNSEGYSPLHLAARQLPNNERSYTTTWNLIRRMSPSELHARTPSILGAANARPDVDDGSTAMHIAVNASNTHVLKAMAESDAIIETTEDTSGFTTLQHAVMYGKKDAVATWLEHRNLNLSINAPDTIILMQLAATSGKNLPSQLADDIGSLEDYASIIDLLIQYGAKPYYTHRDNNLTNTSISGVSLGTSPLYLAVKHKNRPAVIALLKHGAKGHETYGLLWKEFPLSMCSAHVIKIVFTLILLPFYFIGFHTPFKKSSYCKLALGTHRMSAFFDGSVFRKSTKPFAKTDTPPQRTATDQFNSGEVSQGKPTACEQEAIEMTSLMVHRGESGDGERPTDEATTTDGNTIFTQYHIHPIAS